MNSLAWIGIIAWGLVVTGFGLFSATPLEQAVGPASELAAHDVIFLVSGGLLTCLIGIVGLLGFMGWIPGLQIEQKSRA
jgi:glucose uptake protein GlcU